jgi:hypothetical protein
VFSSADLGFLLSVSIPSYNRNAELEIQFLKNQNVTTAKEPLPTPSENRKVAYATTRKNTVAYRA